MVATASTTNLTKPQTVKKTQHIQHMCDETATHYTDESLKPSPLHTPLSHNAYSTQKHK